ncbi:MAG: RNA polymerase factor sigma-54 [Candidatus Cloacimonetes bacterium]|nr:RNA polymerase factor sigma-54 [Candidatus Cloacimonadota bacterium]
MTKIQQVLSHKQVQELALKPKMLQSLQLLVLPQMELEMQLKRELELNPILELQEEEEENIKEDREKTPDEQEETVKSEETPDEESLDEQLLKESINEIKEFSDILDEWNDYHREVKEEIRDKDIFETYNNTQYDDTIKDKKNSFYYQLEDLPLTEEELEFARELVENTNEFGYLTPDFDIYELSKENLLSVTDDEELKKRAEEIHQTILKLKPRGITARSISECLVAQLNERDNDYELLSYIIKNHFNDLIHRRYQKIAAKLSVHLDKILLCRDAISLLNPKPGLLLLADNIDYVSPDVIIKKIEDEFVIIVNDFNIPHLTISRYYRDMIMTGRVKDKEMLGYIRDKINSAKFLIKSLYMRNQTLIKVTKAIIEHQRNFFYNHSGILEPLTYNVIATELHVSESTISRVVKDKYADTPLGMICLRDFFTTSAGKTENYEDISRDNVQKQIQQIINSEDKAHPLSDLEITAMLKKMNISVSRRVVQKYRESLGILNSRLRRLER